MTKTTIGSQKTEKIHSPDASKCTTHLILACAGRDGSRTPPVAAGYNSGARTPIRRTRLTSVALYLGGHRATRAPRPGHYPGAPATLHPPVSGSPESLRPRPPPPACRKGGSPRAHWAILR